ATNHEHSFDEAAMLLEMFQPVMPPATFAGLVFAAVENKSTDSKLPSALLEMAKSHKSPIVRLAIASGCQRLTVDQRKPIVAALLAHEEDKADHNLPLMYWYAAEPAVAGDPQHGIELAKKAKIPLIREFISRRLSALATADAKGDVAKVDVAPLNLLSKLLGETDDAAFQKDIVIGMADGLRGWPSLPTPEKWSSAYEKLAASSDEAVRSRMQELSVVFGEERALASLRKTIADNAANLGDRRKAVEALVGAKDRKVVPLLQNLIADASMRAAALRGLAAFDDSKTPELILSAYEKFDTQTKVDALNTLASRSVYARVLMSAVQSKKIAKEDITAATLRQLAAIEDPEVQSWVVNAFGRVRSTPEEKLKEIERWKELLTRKVHADRADPVRGRAMFAKTCQQCHVLFDAGGKVGPDLTGSNRADLAYVLTNVVDPSAVIGKDYLMSIVKTKDARVLSGIVKKDDGNAITLQTEAEQLVIPKSDVTLLKEQPISMMPEGLLAGLKRDEVRDLVAYLGTARQVPMLATEQNAANFFNGKDLTGWTGDPKLWKVENGEIVGKSGPEGLKRNQFLFSHIAAGDFRLTFKVKLIDDKGNSGVQFRSEAMEDGEAKGYQADVGPGWWGKLYEENGRALLWKESGEAHVKKGDWNDYQILAVGSHIKTFINGKPCVDLDDPPGAKRGIFGLQLHSGEPTEVRFKDIKLEVDPKSAVSEAK
ncbi:MAG: hypothetical protein QOF78_4548, partial [Phycisphaerales bacterium]|nr:hypothetical protein [Phycisphaerales bacterium]